MRRFFGVPLGMIVAVAVVLIAAPPGAATTYAVNANPYTVTHTILSSDLWHSYELTANAGDTIAYSFLVTTTGGCSALYLIQGHSVSPQSEYYIDYSQENCVASYSRTFNVPSGEGTRFSVVMITEQTTDVTYNLTIRVTAPLIPSWLLGLGIVIGIGAALGAIGFVVRRRRAKRMMPPAAGPYPPMPPQQPPYPPMPPPQPPQSPPAQPPMGP